MKIVFGIDVFYPFMVGGGQVHTYQVAKHLVDFGHDVTVVTGKYSPWGNHSLEELRSLPDEETVDGIRIKRANTPYQFGATVSSVPALREMYQMVDNMVRNDKVDVVNFGLYRPCIPFYLAARNEVPTVLTAHLLSEGHGDWRGWFDYDGGVVGGIAQKVIEETVLRFSYDRVMTVSTPLYQTLQHYYPEDRMDIVYNGVALEQYDSITVDAVDPNQIIFIGSMTKRKGVLEAIETVRKARQTSGRDLQIHIIGGGGGQESEVQNMEQTRDYVKVHKNASDDRKIRLLKQSVLLLFPSSKEGFPLVPLEALACRTPFVGYNIPEMQEINELTGGGVLVEYGNLGALADKICELLSDEQYMDELSTRGRESIEESFSWRAIAEHEERIFEEVVDNYDY